MKNKFKAILWVLVVLALFFTLFLITKKSFIFFDAGTVINGQVVELNGMTTLTNTELGQEVRYKLFSTGIAETPLIALDGTRIYTTKPGSVVVRVGEDVHQFDADAGLYIERTADSFIFRGSNEGTKNNTTIPYVDETNNAAVVTFGPLEGVVLTGAWIEIDGVMTEYPPFTYIDVNPEEKMIEIVYLENGNLKKTNTNYVNSYNLFYSSGSGQ